MKKIIFLMPAYNDWESIVKLLGEIDAIISTISNFKFECIVVNDCSSIKKPDFTKPKNFNQLKIINMKNNRGHARCNAAGLKYIENNEIYDYVIVMDSDGEDRPIEIKDLINKIEKEPEISVVAKRIKRSEGLIFKTLYQIHKLITFVFTGKKINFGNYSCLTKTDVKNLSNQASLWSSFSGSLKKNILNFNEINSVRGVRYFGPSKMSLFNLAIHSFSIIAVFKYLVFIRSCFMIIALSFFTNYLGLITYFIQILIVIFNLLILIVSFRENENEFLKSHENILNEKTLH